MNNLVAITREVTRPPCNATIHGKHVACASTSSSLALLNRVLWRAALPCDRYAYGVDECEPGQLKVHLGQVPFDGDYWIVGLGPASFGPDGLYEWAIVSGP